MRDPTIGIPKEQPEFPERYQLEDIQDIHIPLFHGDTRFFDGRGQYSHHSMMSEKGFPQMRNPSKGSHIFIVPRAGRLLLWRLSSV